MKKLLFTVAITVSVLTIKAQENLPKEGNQILQLDIKPVLNLVGNMFNQSENNDFYYSTSVVYKKFLSDIKARRHRFNLSGSGYETKSIIGGGDYLYSTTSTYQSLNLSYMWGTEYRKSLKNVQGYVGYEVGGFFSGSSHAYSYDNEGEGPASSSYGYRVKELQDYPDLGIKGNFILGADYFFSRSFCFGIEVSSGVSLSYDLGSTSKYERMDENQALSKLEVKTPGSMGYRLYSNSLRVTFGWIF